MTEQSYRDEGPRDDGTALGATEDTEPDRGESAIRTGSDVEAGFFSSDVTADDVESRDGGVPVGSADVEADRIRSGADPDSS